jgi:protocatechuate 3,4-dioxygenase beta subunit
MTRFDCASIALRRIGAAAALALAVLTGHVTDRTTGQPLPGVHVALSGSGASAVTDTDGLYRIRSVKPGHYTVTLSSNDVLPQHFDVTVRPTDKTHTADFVACSTTLDYNCSASL